jgi:hypothetical protein
MRISFCRKAISVVFAFIITAACERQSSPKPTNDNDLYATIPFRPKVVYDASSVAVTNTEEEPYLDVILNIYVGAVLYRAHIGSIQPGETITCPLQNLINDQGESFHPGMPRTSELEVRARFRGYDDHKDFPPPP